MTSGSSFEQYKKLSPPFKGELNPIVAESWVIDVENFLEV